MNNSGHIYIQSVSEDNIICPFEVTNWLHLHPNGSVRFTYSSSLTFHEKKSEISFFQGVSK